MKKITLLLLVLMVSVIGFSQSSVTELGVPSNPTDYGGTAIIPSRVPCSDIQIGQFFEQGRTFTQGSGFIPADDIVVSACEVYTPQNLVVRVFTEPGQNVLSTSILFYDDNGGIPGSIVTGVVLAPVSQFVVGSNFGLDVHECTFDLATSGISSLSASATDTTFWLALADGVNANSTPVYWESEFTNPLINNSAVQSPNGGTIWDLTNENQVFALSGDCQGETIPPVAVCQDITIQLDATGNASITVGDIDGGSSDNCAIASITANQTAFTCANVGTTPVTLTVTDTSGNTSTCIANVTVEDNVPPVALCQDVTIQLDAAGNASITGADIDGGSSDACGILFLAPSQTDFTCADLGANSVVLTVSDTNGNTSTCTATVTVEDNVPPVAVCQDITIQLDASGNATIFEGDIDGGSSDNCGIASITANQTAFTCANVGTTPVTLTVTDTSGNTSTCIANVTVEDNVPPVALCQDVTIQLDAAGNASITAADIDGGSSDACGILFLAPSQTDFTCADLGANSVVLTVSDTNGNTSTCTATVTVEDNIPPVAVCQDITVELGVDGTVTINPSDLDGGSTDNCGITFVGVTQFAFDCSDLGPNSVDVIFIDSSNNSTVCTATVTVEDNIAPVIVCPADVTADNDPGVCGATVNFGPAIATDNCGVTVAQTGGPASGSVFPIGTTVVEFTATDEGGNTAVCTFNVTVSDAEAPVVACQDITVELDENGQYSLDPSEVLASATDNCGVTSTSFLITPAPLTSCADDLPQVFDLPQTINSVNTIAEAGTVGVDYDIESVDLNIQSNWANDITITLIAPSGTQLELTSGNGGIDGLANPADLIFTDASANNITGWGGGAPLADYQPEGGLLNSVFAGESITGDWTLEVFDVCCQDGGVLNSFCIDFAPQSVAQNTLDLTCAEVGENTVEVVAMDAAGNMSTCTAIVTVEDNTAPEITCVGAPGDVDYLQEFEGSTLPADWTTEVVSGNGDWTFGSGAMPGGDDFPTNAAIFDDDAIGSGELNNTARLISPVFDISTATTASMSFDYSLQVFVESGELSAEVWDGAAWQEVLFVDVDTPPVNSGTIDLMPYQNNALQVRFTYDDEDDWAWGAGIDNFSLTYDMPSTPYVVELDANGQAVIDASELIMTIDEACGYIVTTVGGTPTPGSLGTLFASDNGGAQGGAVYFDVTVGPEDISVTDIDINTADAGAFTMDVYSVAGSYVGNEGDASAWTLQAVGSGTGAGIDTPSNAVLDTPIVLEAGMSYGMAIVLDASHAHSYTNGDGSNQNYSNADLTLDLGAASNVPFDGAPFSPRVFNGNINYLIGTAASQTIEFDCSDLGVSTVEIQVTDDSGNQAFCTASVEVQDNINPILVCQDATIVLDENGMSEVDPEIFLASAPSTYNVITISSDNQSGAVGTTDLTVDVTDAATVSFDWDYTTADGPAWDSFGYLLNGTYVELTDPNGANNQSGNSGPIDLVPGDVFGFRSQSEDGFLGAATTTISNFVPGFEGQFAPENWTEILTNSDGSATFVEIPGGPLSYDNCGITVLAVDVTDVTCDDIGQTITVTVFASDSSGNLASCTAQLTVVDETGPVIENCPDDLTVDPGANNLFYEVPDYWASGDVTATDNCTDPVTDFSQDPAAGTLLPDGTYTVTLTATDEYGNASQCTFQLTVESVLGLDDNNLDQAVGLYPNPADNFVNIANASGILLESVAIYDMNGRLVQTEKLGNAAVENTIDVSYLASGVYVVQIQGENDAQTVKRLVKE